MKKTVYLLVIAALTIAACKSNSNNTDSNIGNKTASNTDSIPVVDLNDPSLLSYSMPLPQTNGAMSLEKAIAQRRSRRNFEDKELSIEQLSQILWAAYGVTSPQPNHPKLRGGLRTVPSAGALYPFEVYAVIGKVNGVEPGVYKYVADGHKIVRLIDKDVRKDLAVAALSQIMVENAPVVIFYSAIFERTTQKYGDRGRERYVCMDLGHSAQNVYLQAEAMGLGTCAIGAFTDKSVSEVLQLPQNEEPLYLMPVGYY